ncbi:unnamed protein product [Echinostoma caproni]|uniref:Similar to n=1 Tax=Echinostoma caproni TaxID=27848 RepID=A0A183AB53_9TREM|nr:unnamed protein product [Echinostoma caproni]
MSRPNLLQTTPLDNSVVDSDLTTGVEENQHTLFQSPARSQLPDIHLCTTSETRSNPNLDTTRTQNCNESLHRGIASVSRGLPDFLPHEFVEVETDGTPVDTHRLPISSISQNFPLQSTSLPTLPVNVAECHSHFASSSKSFEHLAHAITSKGKTSASNLNDPRGVVGGWNSERMGANQAMESDSRWSTHTTPSSSQADPFVDAHPVSLSGSITSPDPRFLSQQERIEALAVRLEETEQELRETRRLLREQTQL